MSNAQHLEKILKTLPQNVKLVAVSKTKTVQQIMEIYQAGHNIFGENKVQELLPKAEALPKDIEWHMIGHLQTNKVKYIAPFISMIHGVDSLKLLKVINKEAAKNQRIIKCLLQFHIAEEETKFGLSIREAEELLQDPQYHQMQHVQICGVMGMATFTEDTARVRREFDQLQAYFHKLKEQFFPHNDAFREISMGMSDDYLLAVEAGSTMVRIGSAIFGAR